MYHDRTRSFTSLFPTLCSCSLASFPCCIHPPCPISLEIDADIDITESLQCRRDPLNRVIGEKLSKSLTADLYSRNFTVVTHTHLSEPENAQMILGSLYSLNNVWSDPRAIRNSGGETGERRLVPHGEV